MNWDDDLSIDILPMVFFGILPEEYLTGRKEKTPKEKDNKKDGDDKDKGNTTR